MGKAYVALHRTLYAIRRNPVLVGAVVLAAQSLLAGDPWRSVLSVAVGVIVRQFTAPEIEVAARETVAYSDGVTDATFGSAD